jgi:hypothetical protein
LVEKSSLKVEAEKIVTDLNLLSILKKFGDARIVGSVELDLIVKLDIDIHILLKKKSDLDANLFKISKELLDIDLITEIRISDFRGEDSFKVTIDNISSTSGNWSIDFWITKSEKTTAFNKMEEIKQKLNPESRSDILNLKEYFHQKGMLRDGLSKVIYDAVLNEKIVSIGDFESYLKDIEFFGQELHFPKFTF